MQAATRFTSKRALGVPRHSVPFASHQRVLQARKFEVYAGLGGIKDLFAPRSKDGSIAGVTRMGTELAPKEAPAGQKFATFAGGCFWGTELKFQREPGVTKTAAGYTQGQTPNPTYEQVCSGQTGHTEACLVTFDPTKTTYRRLLEAFAEQTDMTTMNRQGGDRGTQYRSGIYYHDGDQKVEAERFVAELNEELAKGTSTRRWAGTQVASEVKEAGDFYIAEGYHQQYLSKGGRFGSTQSAEKGCSDKIRCYG